MSLFNCFHPRKEIICFLLLIHWQVNITNVVESDCAVEWFLPFHSFVDTQYSAEVFKSLIQVVLIFIHIANVVKSACAVEWFLPFHSFVDSQCSVEVFKSFVKLSLIIAVSSCFAKFIGFFDSILFRIFKLLIALLFLSIRLLSILCY